MVGPTGTLHAAVLVTDWLWAESWCRWVPCTSCRINAKVEGLVQLEGRGEGVKGRSQTIACCWEMGA